MEQQDDRACPLTWTCQTIPAVSTKRLASRLGQSAPSRAQSSWAIMPKFRQTSWRSTPNARYGGISMGKWQIGRSHVGRQVPAASFGVAEMSMTMERNPEAQRPLRPPPRREVPRRGRRYRRARCCRVHQSETPARACRRHAAPVGDEGSLIDGRTEGVPTTAAREIGKAARARCSERVRRQEHVGLAAAKGDQGDPVTRRT